MRRNPRDDQSMIICSRSATSRSTDLGSDHLPASPARSRRDCQCRFGGGCSCTLVLGAGEEARPAPGPRASAMGSEPGAGGGVTPPAATWTAARAGGKWRG